MDENEAELLHHWMFGSATRAETWKQRGRMFRSVEEEVHCTPTGRQRGTHLVHAVIQDSIARLTPPPTPRPPPKTREEPTTREKRNRSEERMTMPRRVSCECGGRRSQCLPMSPSQRPNTSSSESSTVRTMVAQNSHNSETVDDAEHRT